MLGLSEILCNAIETYQQSDTMQPAMLSTFLHLAKVSLVKQLRKTNTLQQYIKPQN